MRASASRSVATGSSGTACCISATVKGLAGIGPKSTVFWRAVRMLLNSQAIIYKRRNTSMRGSGMMGVLLMAGALASTGIVAGCAHPHHDYDTVSVSWNAGEEPYYER